ncbi:CocE/NonD family hydrolase [Nodosilinea sp. P-1105]|nr:CocE/NonD family hydrolase [Nodosilinea sp. P-1105]
MLPKRKMTLTLADQEQGAIALDADVYYPDGDGPFPVLLMRQPYGRAIASTVVYAHPSWYASHGYIVAIQDVRGRGTSGGEFDLFRHEADDGYATVLWAADLPQSNGQVGMYGFSYQGMTQLFAAAKRPAPLKTVAPAMVGYDLYHDWAYENGALLLQAGLGWAFQLAAETARRQGDRSAYQALYNAGHTLPLTGAMPARPQVLQELAPDSFFHDWLEHPPGDVYWRSRTPDLSTVDLPMLHIGGWFDPYLRGDLRLYQQMVRQTTTPQHLWIGPWGHIPWSRRLGALDFGLEAESPIDRLQIRWFDQVLQERDTGLLAEPPVHLFVIGDNQWQAFERWPEVPPTSLFLSSTGLAGMHQDDGCLTTEPNAAVGQDVIVHDPWRPVPSLGGHSGLPPGPFERCAIDGRSDVLTYTTELLTQPWTVIGIPVLQLYVEVDAPSFDLSAVLSQVDTADRVISLTQGYGRFEQTDKQRDQPLRLPLHPTSFTLPVGHRLRLSLAASGFPAYPVNSGTGQPVGDVAQIDYRIVTLRVCHGRDWPSGVSLGLRYAA